MLHQNQRVVDNPVYLCDLGASLSAADPPELQAIMEEMDIPKRLMLSLSLLKKELELSKFQAKIGKEEELQLLETPKVENADETDKNADEKPAEDEKPKENAAEEPKKEKKSRCGKLNCTKDIFKCPSIGNCIGPDHFE